jgi:hypothetical protein
VGAEKKCGKVVTTKAVEEEAKVGNHMALTEGATHWGDESHRVSEENHWSQHAQVKKGI